MAVPGKMRQRPAVTDVKGQFLLRHLAAIGDKGRATSEDLTAAIGGEALQREVMAAAGCATYMSEYLGTGRQSPARSGREGKGGG